MFESFWLGIIYNSLLQQASDFEYRFKLEPRRCRNGFVTTVIHVSRKNVTHVKYDKYSYFILTNFP